MNKIKTIGKQADNFQQKYRLFGFGHAVVKKYSEDNAGYWAALLTYYGFLALFPLLMLLTTLAESLLGNYPELEETVLKSITDYFPVLGDQLSAHIHGLQSNGLALVAGILFALYGVRGVAEVFQMGLKRVWGFDTAKKAGFPKNLFNSMSIIVIGGLGFLSAAIIASATAAAGQGWLFRLISFAANLAIIYLVLNILFDMSLPGTVSAKATRAAAIYAAIGLVILQTFGGYLLTRELRHLDALYSYFALTLGLLFWIYLQAQVLYYANEIAIVKHKKLWPRSLQSDG